MKHHKQSEASMLREVIAEQKTKISMIESKIAELEEKHWKECRQIAHYQAEAAYDMRTINFLLEVIDKYRSDVAKQYKDIRNLQRMLRKAMAGMEEIHSCANCAYEAAAPNCEEGR